MRPPGACREAWETEGKRGQKRRKTHLSPSRTDYPGRPPMDGINHFAPARRVPD